MLTAMLRASMREQYFIFFQVASATATRFGLSRGLLGLQYDQINESELKSSNQLRLQDKEPTGINTLCIARSIIPCSLSVVISIPVTMQRCRLERIQCDASNTVTGTLQRYNFPGMHCEKRQRRHYGKE